MRDKITTADDTATSKVIYVDSQLWGTAKKIGCIDWSIFNLQGVRIAGCSRGNRIADAVAYYLKHGL